MLLPASLLDCAALNLYSEFCLLSLDLLLPCTPHIEWNQWMKTFIHEFIHVLTQEPQALDIENFFLSWPWSLYSEYVQVLCVYNLLFLNSFHHLSKSHFPLLEPLTLAPYIMFVYPW